MYVGRRPTYIDTPLVPRGTRLPAGTIPSTSLSSNNLSQIIIYNNERT